MGGGIYGVYVRAVRLEADISYMPSSAMSRTRRAERGEAAAHSAKERSDFTECLRISDVLRSVAEQNMGGGSARAVTRYTLLADVFLFFCFLIRKLVLKNFQISFSVLGEGQSGIKGVNCHSLKLVIVFNLQSSFVVLFLVNMRLIFVLVYP